MRSRPGNVTAPFDIPSVVRRVHFAYRAEGDGWTGGHTTYGATVRGRAISLTPYHYAHGVVPGARAAPRPEPPDLPGRPATPALRPTVGAPLRLETVSIARGDARVPPRSPAAAVGQDGALRLAGGGVTEELENREAGFEQRWRFAAPLRGTGDLVVRVRTAGQRFVGTTERGLHFVDPTSGLGFRYGWASWIDATG
ncbi:MAG: hypothetical protein HY906_20605, partial [Deltaproteobacteria bacterium]|nr:hypothetical protein [Deltaproteobacteria bacterium]